MDLSNNEKIRINKYLSDAGVCSRREADRYIEEGRITIEGRAALPGEKITPGTKVCLDGRLISVQEKKVLLLFNKPRGIVCSTKQQRQETTVTQYVNYPLRVYPVGRLDKDSQGLLLLTNQGDLVNRIMRAGNYHEKEYLVTVNRPISDEILHKMAEGVPILDTVTRPCTITRTGKNSFRIILTQGLNRQIRRMCEYYGYQVTILKRIRIMNLTLDQIEEGKYREITQKEWKTLMKLLDHNQKMKTGGSHGDSHKSNERVDRTSESGVEGILSGRPGNHQQSGVRQPVRPASEAGRENRNRSGKQSHHSGRL